MLVLSISAFSQIPNFGTTVGDQKLYGYSSMKYRAKADIWETYSTLQYGIGSKRLRVYTLHNSKKAVTAD